MLDRAGPLPSTVAGGRCWSPRSPLVFAGAAFGGLVVGLLDYGRPVPPTLGSESIQARDTIARVTGHSASPDAVVLVRLGARGRVRRRRTASWRRVVGPGSSRTPTCRRSVGLIRGSGPSPLLSKDRRSTYVVVTFYSAADEDEAADALVAAAGRASPA